MSNTTYATTSPATEKQMSFIERLLAERDLTNTAYADWTPDWDKATRITASSVIEYLLTLPKLADSPTANPVGAELEAGVYVAGDELVRVYLGQQSGKMLAKRIVVEEISTGEQALWSDVKDHVVSYEYMGAAARVMPADARRLTLEEVGELGKSFDHCLACGRRLDDPESVDRGIGPVCARKY